MKVDFCFKHGEDKKKETQIDWYPYTPSSPKHPSLSPFLLPAPFLIFRGKDFIQFVRTCLCLPNVWGVTSLLKYDVLERP